MSYVACSIFRKWNTESELQTSGNTTFVFLKSEQNLPDLKEAVTMDDMLYLIDYLSPSTKLLQHHYSVLYFIYCLEKWKFSSSYQKIYFSGHIPYLILLKIFNYSFLILPFQFLIHIWYVPFLLQPLLLKMNSILFLYLRCITYLYSFLYTILYFKACCAFLSYNRLHPMDRNFMMVV